MCLSEPGNSAALGLLQLRGWNQGDPVDRAGVTPLGTPCRVIRLG